MSARSKQFPAVLACVAGLSFGICEAKTFVIPHVLEKSGRITDTQFTFDTTLFFTYTGTTDASTDMQFFGVSGAPLECVNGPMPPFSSPISSQQPLQASLEDIAAPAGGFPQDGKVKLGFGILVVGGADPENVNIQGFVTNAHTGPFDLSVFGFDPQPIQASSAQRTLVIPHVLETSGRLSPTTTTPEFDTDISLLYAAGLGDLPPGATGECSVGVSVGGVELLPRLRLGTAPGTSRMLSLRLDDLLAAAGLPPDFDGAVSFDVTGDAWAFASTAFVQHGLDVDNLDDQSFFANAVPEPATLVLLSAGAVLALRRRG